MLVTGPRQCGKSTVVRAARAIELADLQRRFDELLDVPQAFLRREGEHRPDLRSVDAVGVDVGIRRASLSGG